MSDLKEIANEQYYNTGSPILTDEEFNLISDHGLETRNFRNKANHHSPMGSLKKIKTEDDFYKWAKDNTVFKVTPKLDGNSIEVILNKNGNIIQCITRGNGYEGNDVTNNIKYCDTSALGSLKLDKDINSVKCEAIMPKKHQIDYEKNIRNVASGLINRKEAIPNELAKIHIVPFETLAKVIYYSIPDYLELESNFRYYKNNYEYEIDGLVVECDGDYSNDNELLPDNIIALKFNKDGELATVSYIEWSLGKHGILYPVVILDEPVDIDGTTVSRVSASNYGIVKTAGLGIGAQVKVIKSGDIIPQIKEVIGRSDILPPVFCPVCQSIPEVDENGVHLVCKNCTHNDLTLLKHIFKVFNVDYISDATIENLYANGFKLIHDYFEAEVEDISSIDGFGKKTAEYIFYMLNTIELTEAQVLECAMVKGMGNKQCQKLIDYFGSIENFLACENLETSLSPLEGFAEKSIANIITNRNRFKTMFETLSRYCKIKKVDKTNQTKGNIVFTGKCDKYNRKELTQYLEEQGWKIQSSVNKETNLLLTDNPNSSTSKTKKAKLLGIEIKSYDEFFDEK
jgi:DNA ligase (NAD+)